MGVRLASMALGLAAAVLGIGGALANLAFATHVQAALVWLPALAAGLGAALLVGQAPRAAAFLGLFAGLASLAADAALGWFALATGALFLPAAGLAWLARPLPPPAVGRGWRHDRRPASIRRPTPLLDRLDVLLELGEAARADHAIRSLGRPRLS